MAVYTHVQETELTEFLEHYTIGQWVSYKGIAEGVENSNYLLETTQGRFILTLFEQRTPVSDLPFFLGLKQHLYSAGIPCPLPISMKTVEGANESSGATLGQLSGRAATIVSFLQGNSIQQVLSSHCHQVGVALGKLHLAGQSFPMQRKNGLDLAAWRPLLERSGPRSDEIQSGLRLWLEEELDFLEQNWPKQLPLGVIHADLFRDNVFFQDDQLTGLIDFYFACNDLLAYDLAITLNAWCFRRVDDRFVYDPELGVAMLAGYQSQRKLQSQEIEAFSVLCRGAAIRFLLTRLYDWLNVPEGALTIPHDPKEYIQKLSFHQQANLSPA